ncbi:MAG: DNA gyrase C-terminal beta-propeller domain-containing protein [Caldilineaceae bacterium]
MLISYSANAYIKRMTADTFRAQGRGGRGIKGMTTREDDEVINLLFARTLDNILLFTNKGRVYSSKVYELPEGSRTSRGAHIANVLNLMPDETVTTMLIVPDFEQAEYVTLITRKGRIKRVELSAFSNVRSIGVIAMGLDEDDSLDWARLTNGDQEFIVVTRGGKALRFHEEQVRAMGRTAAGVMAIRLLDDDEVVSLDVVDPDGDLLVIHERGWGKRVPLSEYNAKGRYTQGNWTTDHRRLDEVGPIVSARVVGPGDQITVMTGMGIVLRTSVSGISRMGRSTRGVRVVNLQEGDFVAALAILTEDDLSRGIDGTQEDGAPEDGALDAPPALPETAAALVGDIAADDDAELGPETDDE